MNQIEFTFEDFNDMEIGDVFSAHYTYYEKTESGLSVIAENRYIRMLREQKNRRIRMLREQKIKDLLND